MELLLKSKIDCVLADVTKWKFARENRVVYLLIPFALSIMRALLTNLRQSLIHHGRSVYAVYLRPVHEGALRGYDFRRKTKCSGKLDYVVYAGTRIANR
jgi:hypothetical protein